MSWLPAAVSLLPVLAFLAGLILLDSFQLVPLRAVLLAILIGTGVALLCRFLNLGLLERLPLGTAAFSRYVAPPIEEVFKSLWVVHLIRARRIGFLVDAAIHGFAVGAGFALVENLDYLRTLAGAGILLWIVRGFGTALLHGSTTAILTMLSKGLADRHPASRIAVFLPGLAAAAAIHAAYNHVLLNPLLTTALLLVTLPLLVIGVFEHSEKATRAWLGVGFDSDVEILDQIVSGKVGETRIGTYLQSLKSKFPGTVVADMLCLLRIHLELSIRAKGMLMAQEAGLKLPVGEEVKANLAELRYLEKAIGRTGQLAIAPFLKTSSRDLWQIYMLGG